MISNRTAMAGLLLAMLLPRDTGAMPGSPPGGLASGPLLGSAVAFFFHEGLDEKIRKVTARLEQEPTSVALWLERAELHRLHGEQEPALADLERARALDPARSDLHRIEGAIRLDQGDLDAASRALDRCLLERPDDGAGLLLRAEVHERKGEIRPAILALTRAIACVEPPDPDLFLRRADLVLCSSGGSEEEALAGIEEGIRRMGPVVSLELAAIDVEVALSRFDPALARLRRIRDRAARKEYWLVREGDLLLEAGRTAEAREAYRRCVSAIEGLPPRRHALAATRELEERARRALSTIDEPSAGAAAAGEKGRP